ncbi:MAG: LysR family transcriptional regulator [Oxalobacter sp.]|nr:LysR family transcriptional regulator [Oxalobacter sp.]
MDIRQLRYFCAIAEEGQISRAAKRLHIAQPPLSHQLKLLEEELGVQLIERNTRRMSLTQAGHLFYQRATQILGLMHATVDDVRDMEENLSGTLAVGSPPAVGSLYVPDRICRFHQEYPQVHFCWREGNTYRVLELLERDMVEVAMVRLPVPMGNYESRLTLTEPWVVVASQDDSDWKSRKSLSLMELAGVPLILMHRQEGIFCHDMAVNEMQARQIPINIVCESDNISAILSLVERRLGLAVLPESTLCVRPAADFHRMTVSDCVLQSSVALIWKKSRRLSRAATLFIEMFD